jgi:hypothetical protein
MHQMPISTTYVFDAQAENFGKPKCYSCKDQKNQKQKKKPKKKKHPKTECCEMEPIPSKDRAMHEGDNPLF